ncbi:MAG: MBL fold metallo-hydrolase [Chitinivorax sp.]
MMLKFSIVPVTPFDQNCSLIWCDETMRGAAVDPGGDIERILAEAERQGVTLEKILLTHGHLDHVGGTAALAEQLGLPIEGPHPADKFWIDALPQQAAMFGFGQAKVFTPDRWLQQGDTVSVGNVTLQVRQAPGHTPGHVIFFDPASKTAWVGDVLFEGSIGRTDFPGGDYQTLINSIREQLFTLGDEVQFVPGHGPMSTFGEERRSNPFVADQRYG